MQLQTMTRTGEQRLRDPAIPWAPVLMYHRIVSAKEGPDPYRLSISREAFEAQMNYLKENGYQSVPVHSLAQTAESGVRLPSKSVVITFDDGYLETYQYAFPILQEYGLTATVFVVSDYLGKGNDWDRGRSRRLCLMDASQVREMSDAGIYIGSHSITHRSLVLMSRAEAKKEIEESKKALEDLLGREVPSFAFPFGLSTNTYRIMARDAGYRAACGLWQKIHTLFNITRIHVGRCRGTDLRWRLAMAGMEYKLKYNPSLKWLVRTQHLLSQMLGKSGPEVAIRRV
jgi:peptidoglycan/xylan/chitin deacetylase (PgdA/CDA1 family)